MECLKDLEERQEQGVDMETIRNVAGMVYIGELALRPAKPPSHRGT